MQLCQGIQSYEKLCRAIQDYTKLDQAVPSYTKPSQAKCFCTPDRAMDPTFQMKYVPAFYHLWSRRNYRNTKCKGFLKHPVPSYTKSYQALPIFTELDQALPSCTCPVMSWRVLSCLIVSCRALSFFVLSALSLWSMTLLIYWRNTWIECSLPFDLE